MIEPFIVRERDTGRLVNWLTEMNIYVYEETFTIIILGKETLVDWWTG